MPILLLIVKAQKTDSNEQVSLKSIKLGAAVDIKKLKTNSDYTNLVKKQFESLTPENDFKFNRLQKQYGVYSWDDADYLVGFCRDNNKRLHGHVLIFSDATPQWVQSFSGDFDSLLTSYVKTVVSRYKSSILSWDVVNEAFDNQGKFKENIWFRKLGPAYIEKAFRAANAANPNALLFYNDNQLESQPKRFSAIVSHLIGLRKNGVRVDGVGSQMHVKGYSYFNSQRTDKVFKTLYSNGFLIHISELDVGMNKQGLKRAFSPSELSQQQKVYSSIFSSYSRVPEQFRYGITFWGVGDSDSWLNQHYKLNDQPLLFDQNYRLKKNYQQLLDALQK